MLKRIAIAVVAAMLAMPAQAQRCELRPDVLQQKLEDVNQVFSDMKAGKLDGRMVMTSF
jgi:D-arabinose 1-dehydrogenase-like Zn-dependent alcohol dehydrogenase